ncbi:hypothetical protein VTJ04DRAFT_2929 [Mycothermus thermophilus]|uniref:uncharacterized protein n=1 Tax=Humicola insolens TaxID=85995 RepID=UPI003741FC77
MMKWALRCDGMRNGKKKSFSERDEAGEFGKMRKEGAREKWAAKRTQDLFSLELSNLGPRRVAARVA